jgi:hypothetical protein
MHEHIKEILGEFKSLTISMNSYYSDGEYAALYDALIEGKVTALAVSLERIRLPNHAAELRSLDTSPGRIVQNLEILRGSIIPSIEETLKQGGWIDSSDDDASDDEIPF